jgi:hypothetical protein
VAFEVFDTRPKGSQPIPSGEMTVGAGGRCNFPIADLMRLHIENEATVLFDKESRQIAIRSPRRSESPMRLCMTKGRLCKRLALSKVFRLMDLRPLPGRRETTVKDDMLIFRVA